MWFRQFSELDRIGHSAFVIFCARVRWPHPLALLRGERELDRVRTKNLARRARVRTKQCRRRCGPTDWRWMLAPSYQPAGLRRPLIEVIAASWCMEAPDVTSARLQRLSRRQSWRHDDVIPAASIVIRRRHHPGRQLPPLISTVTIIIIIIVIFVYLEVVERNCHVTLFGLAAVIDRTTHAWRLITWLFSSSLFYVVMWLCWDVLCWFVLLNWVLFL